MLKYVLRHRSWPALLLVIAGGCATVDFDYPKPESTAVNDTQDTHYGRQVAEVRDMPSGQSAFYLLIDGIEALATRARLASHAERTLDVQYYLITNDLIGRAFIGSLLRAADRGVRVRLLLDDILTKGYDAGMAALDSHPNFEVRIFNPFAARKSRVTITDIARVNRRMHNKSFTVDNQITIIGGRNIAAEYFAAHDDVNFGDVDVVGAGPVVQDVSDMFDLYWNHRAAVPVPAFAKMPEDPDAALVKLRVRLDKDLETLRQSRYADAFKDSLQDVTETTHEDFVWAPYELVYDSPDKSDTELAATADSIITPLKEAVARAENELIIISPYFVPLDSGVAYLTALQNRGVHVIVLTNSLSATNHTVVHSGYAPYRKALLEAGVTLYEVHPDAAIAGVDRGSPGAALATLHTKGFVVDRKELFFGSFNWDPRSAKINTELGVIMKSPELAGWVVERIATQLDSHTYEVFLNEKGRLRWADRAGDQEVIFDKEPQTSWWRRFKVGFYRMLPIREQL